MNLITAILVMFFCGVGCAGALIFLVGSLRCRWECARLNREAREQYERDLAEAKRLGTNIPPPPLRWECG